MEVPSRSPVRGRPAPSSRLEHAPFTRALLALNVAVFAIQLVIAGGKSLMHSSAHEALAFGASYSLATVGENRYETLFTACFLHDGLLHLAFNMVALWQAGPLVERAVGSARMAPMYLVAGASGNALSVAHAWWTRTSQLTVGASGAICGVLAAALVVGWRVQGWRGPLTQAMARWLALVIAFGVMANLSGGSIANSAHIGGGLAGGTIALAWQRGYRYSERATAGIMALCAALLVACVAVVAVHDRTDPFATMTLQDRADFTVRALTQGRCSEAHDGVLAVQRLAARTTPALASLRSHVRAVCGEQFL